MTEPDLDNGIPETPLHTSAIPDQLGHGATTRPSETAAGASVRPARVRIRYTIALLAMMAGICFLPVNGAMPVTHIHSLNIPDLILIALLAVVYGKIVFTKDTELVRTPLDLPILLMVLVATANLLLRTALFSHDFFAALSEYKPYLYFICALLIANIYRDSRELQLFLKGTFLLATLVGAVLAVRAAAGGGAPQMQTRPGDPSHIYYSFQASGDLLEFWVLCCVVSLLIVDRVKTWYVVVGLSSLVFLVMQFSREWWISIAFILVFLLYMTRRRYLRRGVRLIVFLAMFVLFLEALALADFGPVARIQQLIIYRANSLAWINQTGSYNDRVLENRYAIMSFVRHPFLGIGFYVPYRVQIFFPQDVIENFVENNYLWIVVKTGLIGFVPFCVFSIIFIVRGMRRWSKLHSPYFRGIVVGSLAAYLGMSLTNLAAPHFMQDWQAGFVGILLGVNEAIYRIDARE